MIFHLLLILAGCIAVITFSIAFLAGKHDVSPKVMWVCAGSWLLLLSAVNLVFGDGAPSAFGEEADAVLPIMLHAQSMLPGQQYSHALAGGNDMGGASLLTGQYLSIERLILVLLPLGWANTIDKLACAAIAMIGTYLMTRAVNPASTGRIVPMALAAAYTVGHYFVAVVSWQTMGYALIPLVIYVVVQRADRSGYYLPVIAVAALNAVSCIPTHTALGLFGGLLGGAVAVGLRRWDRWLISGAIFATFMLANWHEVIWAIFQLAPYSARSTVNYNAFYFEEFSNSIFFYGVALSGLAFAVAGRQPVLAGRMIAGLALTVTIGWGLKNAVTIVPQLAPIKPIQFGRIANGLFSVAILIFANGYGALDGRALSGLRRLGAALAVASAAFLLTWNRAYVILEWLSEGGLSSLSSQITQLRGYSLGKEPPVRVFTINYRLSPAAAAVAGLDTLDGYVNLLHSGIGAVKTRAGFGKIGLEFDLKCCKSYDPSRYLDFDMLRIVNVGYLVSVLPLEGQGLRQVRGPEGGMDIPRSGDPFVTRFKGFAKLLGTPLKLRVYELEKPLPRVYAASGLVEVPASFTDDQLLDLTLGNALQRRVAVRSSDIPPDGIPKGELAVTSFGLGIDRVSIDVEAPEGGLVVFNAPYLPFWTASADGRAVRVFPVNVSQMAALVPKGTKHVEFSYARAFLRQVIEDKFKEIVRRS